MARLIDVNNRLIDVSLSANATVNTMNITVQVEDGRGAVLPGVHVLDLYMSENANGIGLTADAYSGDLTASTGAILSALTAKKHWRIVTNADGKFVGALVDTAEPADQYAVVVNPFKPAVTVSNVSGTNWG